MIVFEVTKKVDKSRFVNVVYMDYSKVFDKALHDRLLVWRVKSDTIQGEIPNDTELA